MTLLGLLLLFIFQGTPSASLQGTVTDPSGARVPEALIQLIGPGGEQRKTTDGGGQYSFPSLTPGRYLLRVIAKDFTVESRPNVDIAGPAVLDVQLRIASEGVVVNVETEASKVTVSTDPDANGGALVLGKTELDALSDDPDELARQLQALAGPGIGPQGGQIYADGFTAGVPPKSAIREIRINSNPFSSEYDFPGFGRIEILTKPGGAAFHGQLFTQYNDQHFNSRSPLYRGSTALPPYKNLFRSGNISGPISKDKASFTFDFDHRIITENAFILATSLGSDLTPNIVNEGLVTPQKRTTYAPRLDLAINASHSIILRYQAVRNEFDNLGAGGFNLSQTAFNQTNTEKSLQFTEIALVSPTLINELRAQFSRTTRTNIAGGSAPAIVVQDAFTSGGARNGNSNNATNRWEFSNISIWNRGTHTLKWGGRFRDSINHDASLNNFNGTFTFFGGAGPELDVNNQAIPGTSIQLTALEVYRRTLLHAAGGGPSLFSLNSGTPLSTVRIFDAGLFLNDDWKARPNLTLSYGVRYESQTGIRYRGDWSPRVGFAWGLDAKGNAPAKTVLRGGFGMFYERVRDQVILNSIRYNGSNQQSYQISNPDFFPAIPAVTTLSASIQPQNLQLLSERFHAPRIHGLQLAVDRQINKSFRISVNYFHVRAEYLAQQRNVNAPIPGTGVYPYGDRTVRMLTNSTGFNRFNQININPLVTYKKFTLFGTYLFAISKSDNDGIAMDPYNLRAEWGPANFDIRHRVTIGPNFPIPFLKLAVSPLFNYNSGFPYNITTGLPDPSGDGFAVQRPALVSLSPAACSGPNLRYVSRFGCFNLSPAYGTPTIPRNFGRGPSTFNMTLRVARTWGFAKKQPVVTGRGTEIGPAGAPLPVPVQAPPSNPTDFRYNVTLSVFAVNPLNHPNLAAPNGNLSSPFFGQSTTLQGGFGAAGGAVTYNRKITMQLQLTF